GVANNPHAELVLMEKHGLVTWGETSETCYQKTISIIQEAEQYINDRINQHEVFGGKRYQPLPEDKRKQILAGIMPVIRGAVSEEKKMILSYD
ncbi:bifunctional rhamnulose-1-phosphate aldolase/short-chain dehydrogenase, partial [Escherichia coli]|nr:bifunctional rhamnulose-1-phosphate aldolase/short-chain dehydrogenase [Escherichia coli]